jgi:hypothetical protein
MLWLCAGVQDKHVWRPGENPDDAQVSTSFVATVKVNDSKKPADPQQYISASSTSSRLLFDAAASSLFAPCASHEATPNFSVYRDLLPPTSPASVYTIGYMYIYIGSSRASFKHMRLLQPRLQQHIAAGIETAGRCSWVIFAYGLRAQHRFRTLVVFLFHFRIRLTAY